MVLGSLLAFSGLHSEAGPPTGQLGKTCPAPSQGVAAGAQGRGCQPVSWQRCARREPSLWSPVLLSAGVWSKCAQGRGPHKGRWRKPTSGCPSPGDTDTLMTHKAGAQWQSPVPASPCRAVVPRLSVCKSQTRGTS